MSKYGKVKAGELAEYEHLQGPTEKRKSKASGSSVPAHFSIISTKLNIDSVLYHGGLLFSIQQSRITRRPEKYVTAEIAGVQVKVMFSMQTIQPDRIP